MSNKWPVEWIDSDDALQGLVALLKSEPFLALDTETVGWQTGNERLCLVQIGVPSKGMSLVIDPLAVNLKILEPILTQPDPILVAHNAPFEQRQFERAGMKLNGVVDTLDMARDLRPDLPNHTLQTCVRRILGIEISKEEQTSDWSRRPLTKEQLKYAALDVEVTTALYILLKEMRDRLTIDPKVPASQLMKEIFETVRARLELTKEIAPELAFLTAREELLRTAIRARLMKGDPAYEGEYGKCSVSKIKKTEILPDRVRSIFPEIADRVVREYVEKQTLVAVMKEHGIDPIRVDEVTNIIGHNDRLSLSIKDA